MVVTLLFFFLGLVFGSFFNAVIARMRSGESLVTRSHCMKCNKQIDWQDNIPLLSFAFLRGRCRQCGEKISWQYPLVELGTAVLFAGVGKYVFDAFDPTTWAESAYWLVLLSVLVIIFVYDLLYLEIPMGAIWIGVAAVAGWLGYGEWQVWQVNSWEWLYSQMIWHGVAGLMAFLVFATISKGSGERWMGFGDAWLMLLLGLAAGWPGVLWLVTIGSGIGSVAGLTLIGLKKKELGSQLPFAPFLIAGFVAVIVLQKMFPGVWAVISF